MVIVGKHFQSDFAFLQVKCTGEFEPWGNFQAGLETKSLKTLVLLNYYEIFFLGAISMRFILQLMPLMIWTYQQQPAKQLNS